MRKSTKMLAAALMAASSKTNKPKRRGRPRKVETESILPKLPVDSVFKSFISSAHQPVKRLGRPKGSVVSAVKPESDTQAVTNISGLDKPISLYDLTDMFYTYYKYHNDENTVYFSGINNASSYPRTFSRFATFRKMEALKLGAKPYGPNEKISIHRPNINLGYYRLLLDYLALPYKSIFTDSDLAKIQFDKTLFNEEHLTDKEREDLKLLAANNPNLTSNKEISQDVSNAFIRLLRGSSSFSKCIDTLPGNFTLYGFTAYLHPDLDWRPEPISPLDLIVEPLVDWDPINWSSFFILRKMSVSEIKTKIRDNTSFWNTDALRWAVVSAYNNKNIIGSNHYVWDDTSKSCGENFTVRSFFREMSARNLNIGNYYGDLLVVEGYYINSSGKVDKVIFFPSTDFLNVAYKERGKNIGELNDNADILFFRSNVADSLKELITVIPFDRGEKSLERQRGYGHEEYAPCEMVSRLDCSILNFSILMGVPFTKNRTQGNDAQQLEDMQISANGDMIDLGDRDFIQTPFTADVQSMMAVRGALLQHAMGKAFLGGLDGQEVLANGRGANLANLRLVRDARIHKHSVEALSKGLQEFYSKIFKRILDMSKSELNSDVVVDKLFYETLTNIYGYSKDLFKYTDKELNPETNLPYWISIEAVRNGASHFGAAEMILYSEIKQVFGDALDQRALSALNRMGIKSLLGSQDSIAILGDPRENIVTEKDQIYRATVETATLLGSADGGALSFEAIPVLESKDDHVAHLAQVHNVKAQEIIQRLQNAEVSPAEMEVWSETELETRNNLILKLGALSNHIALHLQQLDRFGAARADINKLKEQTNAILQASEGLMNSLQISLRALKTKQEEAQMRLQNISPENEAAKMKAQVELEKIQVKREDIQAKLMLANKIADQNNQQHQDNQISKARDRQAKIYMNERKLEKINRPAEV